MIADQYLYGILLREAVDAGPNSPLLGVQTTLMPTLRQWAGDNLLDVYPGGSFMKGTAVLSGTDIASSARGKMFYGNSTFRRQNG